QSRNLAQNARELVAHSVAEIFVFATSPNIYERKNRDRFNRFGTSRCSVPWPTSPRECNSHNRDDDDQCGDGESREAIYSRALDWLRSCCRGNSRSTRSRTA